MTGGLSRAPLAAARDLGWFAAVAVLVLLQGPAISAQEPAQHTAPPIHVSVDRVNVGVIVTDSQGRLIKDLRRDDFEILDNGAAQPLTAFLSVDEPAQIVLMTECGPAVVFFRNELVSAADTLLTRLAAGDRVAIVCYTRKPELRLDFTTDKNAARVALRELNFGLGYGDLNLSSSLFSMLDSLKKVAGKKTIVLVTSGVDTSPPADRETIKEKLNASDVRILAISTAQQIEERPKQQKMSKQQSEKHSEVTKVLAQAGESLRELSQVTGGRVYMPKSAKDFDRAYAEIAELVRHEYDLEFAPSQHDGKVHAIEVRVKGNAYQVDHRQAYLAPAGGDQRPANCDQ